MKTILRDMKNFFNAPFLTRCGYYTVMIIGVTIFLHIIGWPE